MTGALLPEPVHLAIERADRAGFSMSCDPGTGRLLAVLAAAVPPNGRVLELGTGTGVGTAWITHGLQGRGDVEVVTVEIDAATAVPLAILGQAPHRRRHGSHPQRRQLRPDLRRCPGREVGRTRHDG